MALIKPTQTKSKDALVNGESSIITLLCRFFWGLNSLWIMFLLLWLQTIPSQTALSGANPISRRIAELSGCVGVCAHGRTAGSQWEQTALPTASLASPALPGPRKRSRQVLGETPSRKTSPYLSSPRARGLVRAVLLLPAGAQRWAWLLTRREGKGRAGRQKPRRTGVPPAFPHVPQAQLSSHPHKIPKGIEAQ